MRPVSEANNAICRWRWPCDERDPVSLNVVERGTEGGHMASVGNTLEGRMFDLTAAQGAEVWLAKDEKCLLCVMISLRKAGLRVTVSGRPPCPRAAPKAGRAHRGGWRPLWAFFMARERPGPPVTISESRRRTCAIAGPYAPRRELSKSVEFLDFGQILT